DLAGNRQLLAELVAAQLPSVSVQAGPGTYLAWLDCRGLGLDADPAEVFLQRARVALNSGPEFGNGGQGRVRLNYGTTPEILTEAVSRMASVVEAWPCGSAPRVAVSGIPVVSCAVACPSGRRSATRNRVRGNPPWVQIPPPPPKKWREVTPVLCSSCETPNQTLGI